MAPSGATSGGKRRIIVDQVKEPEPGLWSNCFVVGNQFFISGQVGRDPTGKLVGPGDALAQSIQAFKNIKAFVDAIGARMDDIVRLGIYLTDIRYRPAMIEARRQFFTGDFPAAVVLGNVTLAASELLVEIEAHGVFGAGHTA